MRRIEPIGIETTTTVVSIPCSRSPERGRPVGTISAVRVMLRYRTKGGGRGAIFSARSGGSSLRRGR